MARRYATVDNIISALVADMIDTGLYYIGANLDDMAHALDKLVL